MKSYKITTIILTPVVMNLGSIGPHKNALLMASDIYEYISGHKNCHLGFRFSIPHSGFLVCFVFLFVFCLVSCHFRQTGDKAASFCFGHTVSVGKIPANNCIAAGNLAKTTCRH